MGSTLSVEDLAELNTPVIDSLGALIAGGDTESVVRFIGTRISAHRRCIAGLSAWGGGLANFLAQRLARGRPSLILVDIEKRAATLNGVRTAPTRDLVGIAREILAAEDSEDATRAFAVVIADLRARHAAACDAVTMVLSEIYAHLGIGALEEALRTVAEDNLLAWMPVDLDRDLRTRVYSWASLLRGNFAEISVRETAEGVELVQNPCGTCGRQVLDGRYEDPGFAVVAERHPLTWWRPGEPVYRTHVALVHDIVPRERIGNAWPVFRCPTGLEPGECVVLLSRSLLRVMD